MYKRYEFYKLYLIYTTLSLKEMMNTEETTNTITISTNKEGNYKQFK